MNLILTLGLAAFASAFSLRTTDPMLTVIAADLGVGVAEAALLASAYTLPYAAMQLILGPVGDAIGKTRLIRLSLVVLTVGVAFSAVAPDYGTVLAARVLAGGFAGGIIPAAMALIGDRVAYTERSSPSAASCWPSSSVRCPDRRWPGPWPRPPAGAPCSGWRQA